MKIICRQADGFYFNVIPFSDDLREFQFKSFSSMPESLQPNNEQQEAADNLVRMLDLSPDYGEELLQPEQTVNPILQVGLLVICVLQIFCTSLNIYLVLSAIFH